MDSNVARVQKSAHAATPLPANPAASGDGNSGRPKSGKTQSASTVEIYQDIHHSLDLLMERTLVRETVAQENARVLPRLAAVERRARVRVEASSPSHAPAQNGPHQTPAQLHCYACGSRYPQSLVLKLAAPHVAPEEEACNDLTKSLERRTTPVSASCMGEGETDMQAPENSQDDRANCAPPSLQSDQASNVSQSADSVSYRDGLCEDGENITSDDSSINSPSAEILEHHLSPTISTGMSKEKELQARRTAMKDYSGSQLTNGNVSSGEIRSPEPRNGMNRRKRKHASGQCEHEDEPLERVVESFGMDSDLEHFEQIVDKAKENAHWVPGSWTPRALLLTPDVGPLQFVQALSTLVKELEDNDFAERLLEVKQRMALAHFYSAYRSAHANHKMFVRWTDGLRESGVNLTPPNGRRTESVVKQRFIDIVAWQSRRKREQAAVKINNWQRCGKP